MQAHHKNQCENGYGLCLKTAGQEKHMPIMKFL